MVKKIHDFFAKDFSWKILSLFIAVLLWFTVMNINNPIESDVFRLPLEVRNESVVEGNGYIFLNENALKSEIIEIRVRGPKSDLEELQRNKENFVAYIDLEPIDISQTDETGKPQSVNVKYELPKYLDANKYEILEVNPPTVDIILDKSIAEIIPITAEIIGVPMEGYFPMAPVITPESVTITGAKSVIESISAVNVSVDVTGVSDDITTMGKIMVMDENGVNITESLQLSIAEAQVSVPVDKYGKIPISATVSGIVAPGYKVNYVKVTPEFVEVEGDEIDIETMKEIKLAPLDVNGMTDTYIENVDLAEYITQPNISIKDGTPTSAKVEVNISKVLEQQLTVPTANIATIGTDKTAKIVDGTLTVVVNGSSAVLTELSGDDVMGVVDLTGFEAGVYEVPVELQFPNDVKLVGAAPVITVEISGDNPDQISGASGNTETPPPATAKPANGGGVEPEPTKPQETGGSPSTTKEPIDALP